MKSRAVWQPDRAQSGNRPRILQSPLLLALTFVCAGLSSLAPLALAADEQAGVTRPRIGLVLGGGGARGAAHVGVLKVLEELRVPVDYVVGTSMGSIVGGLYASGMSPEEIESQMRALDWDDLFQDYPPRQDRSFRRKRDDDTYAFKLKPGFSDGKVKLPLAYIHGQKFDLQLNRLTLPVAEIGNFDRLAIPYRAVAADLETGEEVVLGSGSLARSIRASMAVPGAFDPVEIEGRLLVDGGIANNVPVSVARDMGAEVLIVVDVGSGLYKREDIHSALDVTVQLTNFLFTLNTRKQLASLAARDVLIRPPLGDIGGGSFDRVGEAIPVGERAAREMAQALSRYSLSPEDYARHVASRGRGQPGAQVIDFVRIDNRSRVSDAVIAEHISAKPGQALDEAKLQEDIGQIYGLEIFESVQYELVKEGGKTGLVVSAREKSWGPGYIQMGLSYSDDLGGHSTFNIGALYTLTEINKLNGEWRLGGQLGDEPSIFTDIYQPLDPLGRYFVSAKLGYLTRLVDVFDDDGDRRARYKLAGYDVELGAGRNLGTWGEIRLGYVREGGTAEVDIGEPAPDFDFDTGYVFLALTDDKLDNLYFPRSGHFGRVEWRASREGFGADTDFDQILFTYNHAFSWGRNTLIGGLRWSTTLDDDAPIQSLFQAGGFLRLSGLQQDQLSGQHFGLGRLIYMRRIGDVQFLPSYVGGSLELGNVWQDTHDISFSDTIFAGSVFFGSDTPIGPFYVGYGRSDTGEGSLYIFLGPLFTF
jgi:NTE family protein